MPVHYRGKIIADDVCAAYEGNDALLFADLGQERPVPNALFCVIWRNKRAALALGKQYSLSEEEIDTTLTEALMDLIENIKRGQKNGA
jgi:hypothetical protein